MKTLLDCQWQELNNLNVKKIIWMENIWEGPDMIQIEGGKTEVEHKKKMHVSFFMIEELFKN